ncbi:hypothetical protein CC86DRAFT_458368 [Ophiobolus disseminans]|uniref:Mid2 domain-containing protein n=1 Tax=Ophiobolus disseminans TaxID=1469910 RepID=A0A6A6ZPM9_9PLEO|nr:hypothetical protein CC86DRAFT_458368 [Ophiobolus disseminans]
MSSSPVINEGFAIRRDTGCLPGLEVDCGITRAPFRGCCPIQFTCPTQYNIACCPSGTNCTTSLVAAVQPACSNATWDLFDNGGLFCCEHGLRGYNVSNTNGCGRPGGALENGAQLLTTIRVGIDLATIASISSRPGSTSTTALSGTSSSASTTSASITPVASSMPTQSPSSTPSAGSSSSTPVAAIAGGVVGGVVGIALLVALVWFFIRKKQKATGPHGTELYAHEHPYPGQQPPTDGSAIKYAHRDAQPVHEMVGHEVRMADAELPAAVSRPVELDGRHHVRS